MLDTGSTTDTPWRFVVNESFSITGRGTAVTGTLFGEFVSGMSAEVVVDARVQHVDRVSFEMLLKDSSDQPAFMLYGVAKEQVPPGAVIRGPVP